ADMISCVLLWMIPLLMVQHISSRPTTKSTSLPQFEQAVTRYVARSCKEVRDRYNQHEDGLYYLTTASGVNNIYGKCTVGDRWSSQKGSNPNWPDREGNWANMASFGIAEGTTTKNFKNPGYYDIVAEDMSVWHISNNSPLEPDALIQSYLHHIPIVYDHGDTQTTRDFYGPIPRNEFQPGLITFRAINNEKATMAISSGVKPTGCNSETYCIQAEIYCSDFYFFYINNFVGIRFWQ
uniref:Uncharacterized protein n=1 Tax=Hucho hucho TaxID=62062 RepID=A0A4W5MB58_9TELE